MVTGLRRAAVALAAAALLFCEDAQVVRLRADLEFLTSEPMAGRVSLSPQADIAARYIAAGFEKAGLETQLQEFPLVAYRGDPKGRRLLLTRGGATKPLPDFTGGFFRDVDIKAAVVFAGYGITAPEYGYDDYAGIDVAGKIALMFDHEPQENDPASVFNGTGHTLHAGRHAKVANARRHGAVAVLIAPEPDHQRAAAAAPAPLRGSAPPQSIDDLAQIPAFNVNAAVLEELLGAQGGVKPHPLPDTVVEIRSVNAEQKRGMSLNAIGILEGSDPVLKGESILLTAHYDHLGVQNGHLYPGANDNGSGTVAVIELARMFARDGARPKRSIVLAVFGSEEQLMLGSFWYTAHPVRPLAGTRAVLNLDMIGRDEAEGAQNLIELVGTFYSPDLLGAIQSENRKVGLELSTKLDADHTLNVLFRCDHLPFLLAGVPAAWFFGGFHPGYHEPSDTVEKLNFPKMQKVIALAYGTAINLANAKSAPAFGVKRR